MNTTFNTNNAMVNAVMDALASVKGHQFVGLVTETSVRMNKRNNPYFGRVTKVSQCNASFNYSYENACNNRVEKVNGERLFVTESLPWGSWIKGYENKFISHNGGIFVRFYKIPNEVVKVTYYLDGVEVTDKSMLNEIISFIPTRKDYSAKQASLGVTEYEKQCHPYAIGVENIVRLTLNGVVYER